MRKMKMTDVVLLMHVAWVVDILAGIMQDGFQEIQGVMTFLLSILVLLTSAVALLDSLLGRPGWRVRVLVATVQPFFLVVLLVLLLQPSAGSGLIAMPARFIFIPVPILALPEFLSVGWVLLVIEVLLSRAFSSSKKRGTSRENEKDASAERGTGPLAQGESQIMLKCSADARSILPS